MIHAEGHVPAYLVKREALVPYSRPSRLMRGLR